MGVRKSNREHELNGSWKHDPQRRRPPGLQDARPLGDKPDRLPAEVQPYWDEIVAMGHDVLRRSDRWTVEIAARLMEKALRPQPAIESMLALVKTAGLQPADVKRLLASQTITATELTTLTRLLASMGLDPTARLRLCIPAVGPENSFADLAAESRRLNEKPN